MVVKFQLHKQQSSLNGALVSPISTKKAWHCLGVLGPFCLRPCTSSQSREADLQLGGFVTFNLRAFAVITFGTLRLHVRDFYGKMHNATYTQLPFDLCLFPVCVRNWLEATDAKAWLRSASVLRVNPAWSI